MNIFLDMVGCRLNQSEIETFARQFRLAGHSLVSEPSLADVVVINTCTVTAAAASDSRQKIRQAARARAKQVIVTGCHATLNPHQTAQLPGVTQVINNSEKDNLVPIILKLPASSFDQAFARREPIPGVRLRTRAFIKVQDGCDNHCTYCITRLARGAGKSRPIPNILMDIQSALEGGCQEIVLTGVHLGSWGNDFDQPSYLYNLVRTILDTTDTPRLHLSSIEPWEITAEFFGLWQNPRLCRHLHLPLQSGCATTLQRMGRKVTPRAFADLVRQARQFVPGISITTDVITGFPGETEDEFRESVAFITEMDFSGGHVFTFSPRPGTPAMHLPQPINPALARQRNYLVRQVLERSASVYAQRHVGQILSVLWEKAIPSDNQHWHLTGLTDNYLRVRASSPTPCRNQIISVRITSLELDGLQGEILLK